MSTTLQVLANYYESVIQCEQIYSDHIIALQLRDPEAKEQHELMLTKEAISLKKQMEELVTENVIQQQEIEKLREVNKTQRSVLESKLETAKKQLAKYKEQKNGIQNYQENSNSPGKSKGRQSRFSRFHLLSPMQRLKSGERRPNKIAINNRVAQLRQLINEGQKTIFDDTSDDSMNRSDEMVFIESLKQRSMKAKDSSKDIKEFDDEGEARESDISTQKKKRKLSRKRIETVFTDNEEQDIARFKDLKNVFTSNN
ncbi:HFL224Cp [Eremothecium sinecaudum]|uniref:HFL224Cp n=1 Tax=Eremothecium sinecaudum TaxID=45286 RepID=A0A120K2I6_9SACH|nr:HFL224Cp [Eremothecium sinecaudum]AMD21632.1 HFL224Cp [Eremothecium sinecaudum]